MNVIYVMGRLLKAFNIDFNWHHLASWANITEQWPYRTSWITLYIDCEEKLEDTLPLSQVRGAQHNPKYMHLHHNQVYDRVKSAIPTQKEMEPLLEMDRYSCRQIIPMDLIVSIPGMKRNWRFSCSCIERILQWRT